MDYMPKDSNKQRVVVTGLGVVAANGNDRHEFSEGLFTGKVGIRPAESLDMSKYRTKLAGEVKRSTSVSELEKKYNSDRTVFLAIQALNEAITDSGLSFENIQSLGRRAGLSFATSLGGNSRLMNFLNETLEEKDPRPEWLCDMNFYTNFIAKRSNIEGCVFTTVSACAAGTAAAGIAIDMIRFGRSDVMVVGGSDPLTELSMSGFHSLKSLSPVGSKPFDKKRDGLIIGEGAAMFIFESLEHAQKRGAQIYGEVIGYGISNDAYHITSPDPKGGGAIRAMQMALQDAGINPENVDYINAHGTSTLLNDQMELKAIREVFGEHAGQVYISSTKSMTGHCLGAAGSIELAACLLALKDGFVPPTATLEEPEESFLPFRLVKRKGLPSEIRTLMSNSFAFAGNTASIIVRRYET
jgi:3-oxoacyl-[acyl-carrier-protein] synthase II